MTSRTVVLVYYSCSFLAQLTMQNVGREIPVSLAKVLIEMCGLLLTRFSTLVIFSDVTASRGRPEQTLSLISSYSSLNPVI